MNASSPPLIDSHGRSYRRLRARDVLAGDEILFAKLGAEYRVEAVDADALGQPRLRYGNDTATTSFAPTEWLRVAESPGLEERDRRGWERQFEEVRKAQAALPPFVQISEEDFFERYKPVMKAGDDNVAPIYENHEVKDKDRRHVWTIVEGDDGGWYATPEFHVTNMVGYTLTEQPWEHENMEAVYFEGSPDEELDNDDGGMHP